MDLWIESDHITRLGPNGLCLWTL